MGRAAHNPPTGGLRRAVWPAVSVPPAVYPNSGLLLSPTPTNAGFAGHIARDSIFEHSARGAGTCHWLRSIVIYLASSGKRVGDFGPFFNCCLLLLLSLWACGQRPCVVHMPTAMRLFQALYL